MPLSQGWKTFLRNHADGIASMDLFLVPTISFRLLFSCRASHSALGCAVTPSHRSSRRACRCANFGRAAPPIYPSVSFR
jgi:hypothetical protein